MKYFKHSLINIMVLFCAFSCQKEAQISPNVGTQTVEKTAFVPNTLLVEFDQNTTQSIESQPITKGAPLTKTGVLSVDKVFAELAVTSIERVFPDAGEWEERHREAGLHRFYHVKYDESKMPKTKAGRALASVKGIVVAEPVPNRVLLEEPIFNDPYLSSQWHYINPGNSSKYLKGADINVLPVWKEFTTGKNPQFDVIVSVVDGGVDPNHPDLQPVFLSNVSYNFIDGKKQVTGHDHGTHVAGTIGAVNNNGIGVCGIAGGEDGTGGVKIMSCQVFNNDYDYGSGFGQAMVWGADHGAVISQNSWGNKYKTLAEAQAGGIGSDIRAATEYFIKNAGVDKSGNQTGPMKGGVVIFAAGNDNWPIGWPAAYESIISVGAIGSSGRKAYYSNYGDWVDIAAPGGDAQLGPQILSTTPGGSYNYMQGTSMACPHVSGVAALIVSYFGGPGFTNEMLKERLLGGARTDFLPSNSQIGPLVDAYGSFCYGSSNPPEKVSSYKVEGRGGSVEFTWNVGANSEDKPAHAYLLLASKSKEDFTNINFKKLPSGVKSSVTVVGDAKVGEEISGFVGDLGFSQTYYVALVGYDYGKSYGELSEVKVVKTTKNSAPIVEEVTPLPWNVLASKWFTGTVKIYDPDNHYVSVKFVTDSKLKTLREVDNGDGTYSISVNGVAEESGKYKVSYVVTDTYEAITVHDIVITVLENRAPIALKEFDNLIFEKKGQSITLKISDYFTDPDEDVLSYVVEHSNPKVAHLNPLGDEFTLTTLSYGIDEITVKAMDARKAEAVKTFKVVVRDPKSDADIYPTQITDVLNISGGEEATTEIYIYSATGAEVYHTKTQSSAFDAAVVDMSSFAPGIYTVKVIINGVQTVKTVVKL